MNWRLWCLMAIIPIIDTRFSKTGSPVRWMNKHKYDSSSRTEKIVAWADALVGIREAGENKGFDVQRITSYAGLGDKGGFAWCAMFVYYIVRQAGVKADLIPKKGDCAAVRNWVNWAESKGRLRTTPARGRLFFWLGRNGQGHIGICLGGSVMGVFRTIEGNTNGGGSRDGDGSYKRTRTLAGLMRNHRFGFIDLEGL